MTGTDIATRTPGQQLAARIAQPDVREQLELVAESTEQVDLFVRAASRLALTNPEIAEKADQRSFISAIVDCVYMGLIPDGKHATIVLRKDTKTGRLVAVAQPMVRGIIDNAAEHGWHMRVGVAYENDRFEFTDDGSFIHVPVRPGSEPGALIAAWARAIHRDGREQHIVMDAEAVAKRRAKAQHTKIWDEWVPEMWKKTAAHRLYKELPLDPADRRVARLRSDAEPAVLMYGPEALHEVGLPGPGLTRPLTDSGTETSTGQQAAPTSSESVGAAPGPSPDEIEFGASAATVGADIPIPEPEPVGFAEPEFVRLANRAATTVPPFGKYGESEPIDEKLKAQWKGPHTLAQILAADPDYILWVLKNVTAPPDYVQAVETFARVFAPEAFHAALAEREASA